MKGNYFIVPRRLQPGLPLGHSSSCFRVYQVVEEVVLDIGDGASSDALPGSALQDRASPQHPVSHRPGLCWEQICCLSSPTSWLRCGCDVDPINSVQFSNNTGYPTFRGHILNGELLLELIEGLTANDLLGYTHLLTGYIGSISFLHAVLQVVDRLRTVNPGLVYVCDPVMGDGGKLYVPLELVSVYRDKVVPIASMLTPNQFEVELLTGVRITSESDGLEACNILHAAGPSKVVITSLNLMGKLLLIGSHQKVKGQLPQQFKIVIPKIPAYFTGTGDLTTALLLGWSNKYPENLEKASELAVSSVQALLQRTLADYKAAGFDPQSSSLEIRLIQSQDDIKNPEVKFKAEKYL